MLSSSCCFKPCPDEARGVLCTSRSGCLKTKPSKLLPSQQLSCDFDVHIPQHATLTSPPRISLVQTRFTESLGGSRMPCCRIRHAPVKFATIPQSQQSPGFKQGPPGLSNGKPYFFAGWLGWIALARSQWYLCSVTELHRDVCSSQYFRNW